MILQRAMILDPTSIVVVRQPTKFDKLCDSLAKMIVLLKDGSVPCTEDQCQEALIVIEVIKKKHADLQTRTSALSEQIIQIQSQLATEVLLRKQKYPSRWAALSGSLSGAGETSISFSHEGHSPEAAL